jgi:hypothetical protein
MQYVEDVCSAFCPFQNVSTNTAFKPYCLNGVYKKLIQSVQKYDWKKASKIAYKIAFLKEVAK